ncbi:rod shape-determining protein [Eubacterium sp.]|uniref:rod shape-determining protein n=1 Tax=Eubacterium sp. TaxID=142586 RepID=UPI0025E01F37|nr:rod shape-determining protein [Eubacterium sp.]MCR5628322.1 rod shape-determining protein [Eubacterium sp.]
MAIGFYGVDIGSNNIKIYNSNTKEISNFKNIVAIKDGAMFDYGNGAYEMYEKTPTNIKCVFPVTDGVITDMTNMISSFEQYFIMANKPKMVSGGKFLVAVPTDITEIEKHGFSEVVSDSNIKVKELYVVERPIAEAVGLGIDINKPNGNMIINIGGSTTEISILSQGGLVLSKIIKMGGNILDDAITSAVKKKYNLLIGVKTAERIKNQIADVLVSDEDDELLEVDVYGRNMITGLPSSRQIGADVVNKAITHNLNEIIYNIKTLLDRTPPELIVDIKKNGIYLTGGTSSIRNLDILISNETGFKVNTVNEPGESVIRGVTKIISDSSYKNLMYEPKIPQYL